jgi:hypothetical protein
MKVIDILFKGRRVSDILAVLSVFLCFVAALAFGLIYKFDAETPVSFAVTPADQIAAPPYKSSLDEFTLKDGIIFARGWACKTDEEYSLVNIAFLLKNTSDGRYYKLKTIAETRPDVTQAEGNGYNLDNAGWQAQAKDASLPDAIYQPCFIYTDGNGNRHLFTYPQEARLNE